MTKKINRNFSDITTFKLRNGYCYIQAMKRSLFTVLSETYSEREQKIEQKAVKGV